jgi:hypothetical protein
MCVRRFVLESTHKDFKIKYMKTFKVIHMNTSKMKYMRISRWNMIGLRSFLFKAMGQVSLNILYLHISLSIL